MADVFFDTSALVKLLLNEADGAVADRLWATADTVTVSRLAQVEVHAALAAARRAGRIDEPQRQRAAALFDGDLAQLRIVELTVAVAAAAAELSARYALSGADAVHLASALVFGAGPSIVFATWDRRLHDAASRCGFAVPTLSAD